MKLSKDEWELVMARVEHMPQNFKLAIGIGTSLSKQALLQRVKAKDEIGLLVAQVYLNYLRSFKKEVEESG